MQAPLPADDGMSTTTSRIGLGRLPRRRARRGCAEAAVHDVSGLDGVSAFLVVRAVVTPVVGSTSTGRRAARHNIFSTTKLLTVLAMGAAADDGSSRARRPWGEWVEEIAGRPADRVTLEQLLAMRSGRRPTTSPLGRGRRRAPLAPNRATYEYVTNNSELLALGLDRGPRMGSAIRPRPGPRSAGRLRRSLARDALRQRDRRLRVHPRELARLEQLLLDDGRWAGEQSLPSAWIDAMTESAPTSDASGHAATATSLVQLGRRDRTSARRGRRARRVGAGASAARRSSWYRTWMSSW